MGSSAGMGRGLQLDDVPARHRARSAVWLVESARQIEYSTLRWCGEAHAGVAAPGPCLSTIFPAQALSLPSPPGPTPPPPHPGCIAPRSGWRAAGRGRLTLCSAASAAPGTAAACLRSEEGQGGAVVMLRRQRSARSVHSTARGLKGCLWHVRRVLGLLRPCPSAQKPEIQPQSRASTAWRQALLNRRSPRPTHHMEWMHPLTDVVRGSQCAAWGWRGHAGVVEEQQAHGPGNVQLAAPAGQAGTQWGRQLARRAQRVGPSSVPRAPP